MNRRVNITYSISEEEFGPELASLLEKAATYISDATQMLHDSVTALESRDYTNSLVCIAKMRDSLAFTDYRLHDTMTMVASYENALKQSSGLDAPPLPDEHVRRGTQNTKFRRATESSEGEYYETWFASLRR